MNMSLELCYQAGFSAYQNGYDKDSNPWPRYTDKNDSWQEGWDDARSMYEEGLREETHHYYE